MRGDRAAFGRIVLDKVPAAHRLATSVVGPGHADDVVQEAFLDAWIHLPSLRDPRSFDAWLRAIVVNRSRMMLRGSRRRPVVELDVGHAVDRGRQADIAPDFRDAIDQRAELEQAYRRLDLDSRLVLSLHYVADLPISQVAVELGIPIGTAKSRLHSALLKMRQTMGPEDG